MPPAPASPCAQKPAATQNPRTSVAPRMNSPSGVNASGPLTSLTTSASSSSGTRTTAFVRSSSKRSQSSGRSLPVEVRRDPVQAPRRRVALVTAHDEPARLAAEVHEERWVAHCRHVQRDARGLRDQVLVRHRHDRDVDARESADLAGEHPARVDDHLRLDRALVRLHAGHPPVLDPDAGDARVRVELGAALPGSVGEREGELAGVDVAVRREVGGAEDALGGHGREELLRLGGRRRARAGGRTSSPSPPGARAPPCAPPRRRGAASRPRAIRSPARPRPQASGRARPSSSSFSSGSASRAAGRRGRRSGRWSRS